MLNTRRLHHALYTLFRRNRIVHAATLCFAFGTGSSSLCGSRSHQAGTRRDCLSRPFVWLLRKVDIIRETYVIGEKAPSGFKEQMTIAFSVATTLLERGMPIEQIQKFLGHSKLETTQVYAESTTEMIKENYRKALDVVRLPHPSK